MAAKRQVVETKEHIEKLSDDQKEKPAMEAQLVKYRDWMQDAGTAHHRSRKIYRAARKESLQ